MKEIGSHLKEAREHKKLSIQDVAIATKINNKIIKAIEDGDTENLPAKPFLRGFVQTYARYLELNVDDVMKRFLEAHGSTKPKPQITEEGHKENISHEEVQNKFELYKKIAYVVAAVIAIVFIYFIQKVVSRYEQESKIAKEQKEAVKSQFPVDENATPLSEGPKTEEQSKIPITPIPSETKTADIKSEVKPEEKKVEAKPPVPTAPLVTAPVTPKPVTPPPAAATPPPVATAKTPDVKAPEQKPAEVKKTGKSQQLIIEALDNVEIRYSKDGESERTVKLKPEQFLTIKANSKINLNVSDSGAVNIIHNGRDKGVPGNLGQPTKISYP